jgi:hypothetical protein
MIIEALLKKIAEQKSQKQQPIRNLFFQSRSRTVENVHLFRHRLVVSRTRIEDLQRASPPHLLSSFPRIQTGKIFQRNFTLKKNCQIISISVIV